MSMRPEIEEPSEEEVENGEEGKGEIVAKERNDPFAALELPPPVGDDDQLGHDWDGEEFSADEEDHSALGAATPTDSAIHMNTALDDLDMFGALGSEDAELAAFNDPSIQHLDDAPIIGGKSGASTMYGETAAGPIGRATSPLLFAQASQMPTCVQLRAWKWENGVPVGLGVIDAMATEEDLVQKFYSAMPRKGENKCQFKLRPIDINGKELGQEITHFISEHHAELKRIRDREEEEKGSPIGGIWGPGGGDDAGATVASEMSRMMENMMTQNDRRSHMLEESLEGERERMRQMDEERAQERVDMAMNAANGVQALTERMMRDEGQRTDRAMQMQSEQSTVLINTLTAVFGQQQNMMQQFAQQQQQIDNHRIERERVRSDQERKDMDRRREGDREEYEQRRIREKDEMGEKRQEMDSGRRWEREQLELRRKEEDRKWERQMEELRVRVEKDRQDSERRLQRDRDELLVRLKTDQGEAERKIQWEQKRMEREERVRREEGERREQRERDHSERMLKIATSEKEASREGQERRERLEREMRSNQDKERDRRHQLLVKEMELSKDRDREHAERMITLSQREMSSSSFGGLGELIPKATDLLKEVGIEPSDLVGRLMGQGGDSGGWLENLPKILGVASEMVKAGVAGRGAGMVPGMMPPMALPPPSQQMPNPMFEGYGYGRPPPPVRSRQPAPTPPQGAPAEHPIPSSQEVEVEPAEQARSSVGIPLKAQRNARNAIRQLIRSLTKRPPEQWETIIIKAITEEIDIYHYIQAVSLTHALQEAGGEPQLHQTIAQVLRHSELVPADLNYGEVA